MNERKDDNFLVLKLASRYLRERPRFITQDMAREVAEAAKCDMNFACAMLFASGAGLDVESDARGRRLFHEYFLPMTRAIEPEIYERDPYRAQIKFPSARFGAFEFSWQTLAPCEAFPCGEIERMPDGRLIAPIGFFEREFAYPALMENGVIWMTLAPNEIETMREPIARARGRAAVYGLGIGYYAFMIAQKSDVERVTIIEKSRALADFFTSRLLPQFPMADKIDIVVADAFDYARDVFPHESFDFAFADIWHDAGDGMEMLQRLKELEIQGREYAYWIEKTISCYKNDI